MRRCFWGATLLLAGCATLSYRPPEGTEGAAVPLVVTESPRSVALGRYRLTQVRTTLEHTDLPFQEDGGTYTVESGAEYSFQREATLARVDLLRVADVTLGSDGLIQTSVSVTKVTLTRDQAHAEVAVQRPLGSDTLLEWAVPHRVVVSLDFHAWSEGKPATLWTQPAGLKVQRDGELPVYVSLLPPFAVFGVADSSALDDETALALLVGFEAVTRNLDPGPLALPSRND